MEEYRSASEGRESPRVLVLMGLPGSYIVATESSYVGSLVKLAGGMNIYGDGDGQEFLVANTEDMKEKDPDIILRAAHALPDDVVEISTRNLPPMIYGDILPLYRKGGYLIFPMINSE